MRRALREAVMPAVEFNAVQIDTIEGHSCLLEIHTGYWHARSSICVGGYLVAGQQRLYLPQGQTINLASKLRHRIDHEIIGAMALPGGRTVQ